MAASGLLRGAASGVRLLAISWWRYVLLQRPPRRLALRAVWQSVCLALLVQCSPADPRTQACREPEMLRFNIVDKIARSEIGFTQGLEVHDNGLYESTGRVGGTTRLNQISLDGKVMRLTDLGTTVFGEGLTILKDEVFQLTWQEHEVFVYDLAGNLKREMHNPRDGWGLTNDGTDLIFSDGGPSFYYADPRTFAIRKSVRIRTNRLGDVEGLNELELVGGKLFGNIFTTRAIVRIDPASGCIDGLADLSVLWQAMSPQERAAIDTPENVLNGIAYDAKTGLFYLTGKLWKTIFTGRFTETKR
jgi:glutaminyl-peptide cyclotransferase